MNANFTSSFMDLLKPLKIKYTKKKNVISIIFIVLSRKNEIINIIRIINKAKNLAICQIFPLISFIYSDKISIIAIGELSPFLKPVFIILV